MRKWLILLWLLAPVALLSYHFGPGQDALALKQAERFLTEARRLETEGQFEAAIEQYTESLAALPIEEPSLDAPQASQLAVARDKLQLARIRGGFELGRLAETIDSLNLLVADVERRHGRHSPLAYEVRDFLGRVHFRAMAALRLESAEEDVWRRHWELARQNFRYLAENTDGPRNAIDRKNLEVVIKSFNDPPPPTAAAAAGGVTTTAGLNTVLSPPPPTTPAGAVGGLPPPPVPDARPRQPTPDAPQPVANELDLGS
ncbi:MAG: hypothetical protein RIC55_24005 [Pirellulaceae bacterium]